MDNTTLDYLPDFLKQFKEFQEIAKAEDSVFSSLYEDIEQVLDNFFIETADAIGIRRFEKILGITPMDTDTLDDRRFRVKTYWSQIVPYTEETLRRMLINLVTERGYTLEIDNENYTVFVKVSLGEKKQYNAVMDMLKRIVPCNMLIAIDLKYNTNEILSNYTHEQLSAYTHKQLKEEVFNSEYAYF